MDAANVGFRGACACTRETALGATLDLLVADAAVHRDVLGHPLVGVKIEVLVSQPPGLGLRVLDEAAADALALALRQHRDIVEEEPALLVHKHEYADDLTVVVDNVCAVIADDLGVVVEHRARCRADTLDVVGVRGAHALCDARGVGGGGEAGLGVRHGQGLGFRGARSSGPSDGRVCPLLPGQGTYPTRTPLVSSGASPQ